MFSSLQDRACYSRSIHVDNKALPKAPDIINWILGLAKAGLFAVKELPVLLHDKAESSVPASNGLGSEIWLDEFLKGHIRAQEFGSTIAPSQDDWPCSCTKLARYCGICLTSSTCATHHVPCITVQCRNTIALPRCRERMLIISIDISRAFTLRNTVDLNLEVNHHL